MFARLLKNHWFLIALVLALSIGYWLAHPLRILDDLHWLKWSIVSVTMLLMTWPLETRAIVATGRKIWAPMIATILNLVIAPLLAWPISVMLGDELGAGLILAASVPSTLASAAVWTRRAGGNDAIAILVTIITNLLCFLVTPAWVFLLTGIEIPTELLTGTISNLFFYVVMPMVVGQLLRWNSISADWASRQKKLFSQLAQIGILCIVLLGSMRMRIRMDTEAAMAFQANQLLFSMVAVLILHLSILYLGIRLGRWTGHSRPDQIAIGFSGSQKTLMVGLSTAISMGLNIIPIVAYHALQLIADTLIADQFHKRTETDSSFDD